MGRRILVIVSAVVVLLVAVALAGLLVFTNTDYGRERVRHIAESAIQGAAKHGVVRLGRVSGNLLQGFTIANVSIKDSADRPFLIADSVSLNYGLRALLLKRLELSDVRLVRPLVVLDRPPGDHSAWNYRAIFKGDSVQKDTTKKGFGDWIVLRDVTVLGGRIMIRSPWKPKDQYTGAVRDSLIAAAVAGKERVVVEPHENGYQKVIEFRDVNGEMPYLRLAHPDTHTRELQVAKLSVIALPFHPPAAVVNDFVGTLDFTGDSIWFKDARIAMPGTKTAGDGRYVFDNDDFDLRLRAQPIALSDVRFIMPQLPSRGQGNLDFRLHWQGDTSTYIARQIDFGIDSARVGGNFGISLLGDSVWFHDTDVRFSSVDTHLIEQIAPKVNFPRHGALSGSAKLDGPPGLMRVNGDVAFDDARYGRSRVVATGALGTTGRGIRFRDLDLTLDPVQVGLATTFVPSLPIGGILRGSARVNGATDAQLVTRVDLTHIDGAQRSHVAGNATMRLGSQRWLDVDARLLPLSLAEVGKFAPAAGLQGAAAGPVRLTGSLSNLLLDARLALLGGGQLDARGTLDLASAQKGYDITAQARLFNAHSVVAKAPATSLTATAFAKGRGFAPATMDARFGVDMATSTIDTVAIDSAYVRASIANGLMRTDSVTVSGPHTVVSVSGSFGIAPGKRGELTYLAVVDSLAALNRFLPVAVDTGTVTPRPRGYSRIVAQAKSDSAAVARATEIERLATGATGPRLGPIPPPPSPVRRDSTAGRLRAAGRIQGGIDAFDIRGRAGAEGVVIRGNTVRRARLEYAWLGARTPRSAIAVGASIDSARAGGFAMDSIELRSSLHGSAGDLAFVIYQRTGEEYSAGGDFLLHKDHNEVHLRNVALRFDSTRWTAPHPSAIRWGSGGIFADHVELTNGANGRVFLNGNVPPEGVGGLDIVIQNFQAADLAALTQSDLDFRGLVTTTARIEGTTRAPRIRAALGIADAMYAGAVVPDVRATATYASPTLSAHVEVADSGRRVALAEARIPMNLGTGAGTLMPDAPIEIDIRSDGLPLDLISRFTDAVEDVHGRAFGVVRVRGTARHPSTVGALALQNGTVRLVSTGMRLTGITSAMRLYSDTIIIDSIVGHAGGRVFARGGLGIRTLSHPSFDLHLNAENARVLDNDRGNLRADVAVAVHGPFDRATVSGRIGVRNGVIVVPESDHKEVISARDPALYQLIDTTQAGKEPDASLIQQSPLVANLRMDLSVDVARDTWVRTNAANIEIYTPPDRSLRVNVDRRRGAIGLEGEVATDRGEYKFLSKRFQIRRGSAVFVGGRKPDPTLQITGEYEVRLAASQAINIQVQIGGTLTQPHIALDSDAQPPLSQSDLLSYLAFGRTSSSLLQFEGSSLSGGGSGSTNIAGAGAQLVTQQLAAVALGVFVDEFEGQAARSLGAAYVNVTPADLYTELSRSGEISGFFKGTEVEVGKYTDPNTFVAVQARLSTFASNPNDRAVPGIRLQRRLGKGFSLDASFTPRYIPQAPTLERVTPRSTGVFGTFLAREWKF